MLHLHIVLSLLTQTVWSWLARWWPCWLLKLKVRTVPVLDPKKNWLQPCGARLG